MFCPRVLACMNDNYFWQHTQAPSRTQLRNRLRPLKALLSACSVVHLLFHCSQHHRLELYYVVFQENTFLFNNIFTDIDLGNENIAPYLISFSIIRVLCFELDQFWNVHGNGSIFGLLGRYQKKTKQTTGFDKR